MSPARWAGLRNHAPLALLLQLPQFLRKHNLRYQLDDPLISSFSCPVGSTISCLSLPLSLPHFAPVSLSHVRISDSTVCGRNIGGRKMRGRKTGVAWMFGRWSPVICFTDHFSAKHFSAKNVFSPISRFQRGYRVCPHCFVEVLFMVRGGSLPPSDRTTPSASRIHSFRMTKPHISQPGVAESADQRGQPPGLCASGNFGSGYAGLRDFRVKEYLLGRDIRVSIRGAAVGPCSSALSIQRRLVGYRRE